MGDASQGVDVLVRRCTVIYIKVQCNTRPSLNRIPKSVGLKTIYHQPDQWSCPAGYRWTFKPVWMSSRP